MIRKSILLPHIFTAVLLFAGCGNMSDEYNTETQISVAPTPPTIKKRIICEGDSRTDNGGSPGSALDLDSYPAKLARLLHANYYKNGGVAVIFDPSNEIEVINIGLSGDTVQKILANETGQVNPYILQGGETIYILDAGGNDIWIGRAPAQIISDIKKIQDIMTAKGLKVYTATIGDGRAFQKFRNTLVAVNNGIPTTYAGGKTIGKVIDYWSVPELKNFTNMTYFQSDQLHYMPAGNQVKAETAFTVLSK
ncbi:MAG: SGNH/GDSL hydrolase family protein [Acidobacteria bacterium]|jgi:lysophospholipase L1-like esterase|nr:SGNH/GDSL hydrolase family protein [Acidobacteriota bacterium]